MWRLLALGFLCGVAAVQPKHCDHGEYNADAQGCVCHKGWAKAGITDTFNFVGGVCSQFNCESDAMCESHLGIEGATCPVKGWDCYCGWEYAVAQLGHGFESKKGAGGGACMGVMFTFSVWATEGVETIIAHSWKVILAFAALCFPFGRKRLNCDHHVPCLWKSIRGAVGMPSTCDGRCTVVESYGFTVLQDDLAWSLYILDLGIWFYLFLVAAWVVALFVWSILLWAMVILAIVGTLVFGAFAACCEGGGGGADCSGCSCDCAGADCTGCCCSMDGGAPAAGPEIFYWGGPYPVDGLQCYGGTDCDCCCCCPGISWRNCCCCCYPIAWLLFVFPRAPDNAWGGLVGRCFGTHALTAPSRLYQGGNCFVEFFRMAWRRGGDLHEDEDWRSQVYDFLTNGPAGDASYEGFDAEHTQPILQADGVQRQVKSICGSAHAIMIERPFDKTQDRCVESSFNDYMENQCWICQDNQSKEFDLWLSCGHIFCSRCSTEMLRRQMPCPLCRTASSSVLRGRSVGPTLLSPGPKSRAEAQSPEKPSAKLLAPPLQEGELP